MLLHQKGVPSDQAIYKIIQDAAAFGEVSQHKGHIVRSPLPCRGILAPLRARVQRLYTKREGASCNSPSALFCLLAWSARAGALETGFKDQVSTLTFCTQFWLDSPEGWRQRKGWGCLSFPVRTSPTGAHSSAITQKGVLFLLGMRTDTESRREDQH